MVLGLSVSAHRLSRVIGVAEATVSSQHYGESYDNIILVGGFSKAYSSLLAFLALPTSIKNLLKIAAPPYLYSGPSPVASLATVLSGFDVNEKRRRNPPESAPQDRSSAGLPSAPARASQPTSPVSRSSRSHSPSQTGSKRWAITCSIAAST